MTPAEFLSLVWPEKGHGYYCVANPHKHYYLHHVTKGQKAALEHIENTLNNTNAFFAVFTLQDEKVYNEKLDKEQVRTQVNSAEARVFFFDLDVDAELDDAKHYPTQAAAIADIKRMTLEAGLPSPMLVNSGGGVHVYWRLTRSIPAEEWRPVATKLRRLAQHLKIRIDPTRTTDTASVLRVVGTMNVKPHREPREVKLWTTGEVVTPGEFEERLDDAIKTLKVPEKRTRAIAGKSGNMASIYEGLTPTFKQLVGACKQFQRKEVLTGGNLSQGEWYALLGVVRCVEDGRKNAHLISCRHPDYTEEETDKKLDQLEQNTTGSTTCEKLELECANDACKRCPFYGKVNSPIGAAHRMMKADDTKIEISTPHGLVELEIPTPVGFRRLPENKGIVRTIINKKTDEEFDVPILHHDLYPTQLFEGGGATPATSSWMVHLPRGKVKDFNVNNSAFYGPRLFEELSNHGILPTHDDQKNVRDYMVAYIQQLQKMLDEEKLHTHLGWSAEGGGFVLHDRVLMPDGTPRPLALSQDVRDTLNAHAKVETAGTADEQVKAMSFYNKHDNYLPYQFLICCSLGSPFLYATNLAGAIVNVVGESGATKSTALYAAASIWGDPKGYVLDGNPGRASVKARDKVMQVLSNLPTLVDEVTNQSVEQVKAIALEISQSKPRMVLTQSGGFRKVSENEKSALFISTSNRSLYSMLSIDNAAGTAGSMRVVEVEFNKSDLEVNGVRIHSKPEGAAFFRTLQKNHGWIGPLFMTEAIQHMLEIEEEIQKEDDRIFVEGGFDLAERFWSGVGAVAIVICRRAHALGLLPFDADKMRAWFIAYAHQMRQTVEEEHILNDPCEALLSFFSKNLNKTLITRVLRGHDEMVDPNHKPSQGIIAHWDTQHKMLYILQREFRMHLQQQGLSKKTILDGLRDLKCLVGDGLDCKFTLGKGTPFSTAQQRVYKFYLGVPEMAGVDADEVIKSNVVPLKKGNI